MSKAAERFKNRRVLVGVVGSVILVGFLFGARQLSGGETAEVLPVAAEPSTTTTTTTLPATTSATLPTTTSTTIPATITTSTSLAATTSTTAPTPPPTTANQPPEIEDPGISSRGMTVFVLPAVSDPEGDTVEVVVEVDGERALEGKADDPALWRTLDPADVGYEHEATVVISAEDARGNITTETFVQPVQHRREVALRDMTFRLVDVGCIAVGFRPFDLFVDFSFSGAVTDEGSAGWPVPEVHPVELPDFEGLQLGAPSAQGIQLVIERDIEGERRQIYATSLTESREVERELFVDTACPMTLSFSVEVLDQ
jgi:hypothetical protein